VRGQPDPNADPYRTLGLEPGASIAEVKRAYRLLAKAFHPDSAGETAIPRFLAIQEAYEQLATGRKPAVPRTSRPSPAPTAEPWRADPERARAARERARTARTARSGAAGRGGGASTGTSGAGNSGGGTASGTGRGPGRRRDVRKATMGSTSYDEARDPNDATWSGASWYGPSSGEYWIVNPREYADPRKHGPEYQQRARRPLGGAATDGGPSVGPEDLDPTFATTAGRAAGAATGSFASTATGTGAAAGARPSPNPASRPGWARPAPEPSLDRNDARPRPEPRQAPRPGDSAPDRDRVEALGAASRAWLGSQSDDPVRRLGLALVAWPPIGLAAAAMIGDLTGCSAYTAACGGSDPLLPWLAQAAILGLLLLLPPIARLLAGGAIAVLLALIPITFFLLAMGGSGAPQAAPVMATLLAAAWLVGVAWSARALIRRPLRGAAP
jgi:curved DNA-binding protein CbpA